PRRGKPRFRRPSRPVAIRQAGHERLLAQQAYSGVGSVKQICSSRTDCNSTDPPNRQRSISTHCWTTDSGALAPAVISTVSSPVNQERSMSSGPSIRYEGTLRVLPNSASRRLFELL